MLRLVPIVLLAAACTPNNASLVSGSYITFISDGTSLSLSKGSVDPDDYATTYNVDCREFETEEDEDALRLPDALPICGPNVWPPAYEQWATQAGFRVVKEDLEPWRGEALITGEGDFQLAFHHRVPGGADLRFIFSIDPDFAPTECVQDENGKTKRVPLDGPWVENWSTELDWIGSNDNPYPEAFAHFEPYLDGSLYFLNARSYQYDPGDPAGRDWDLPEAWVAGSAQGKYVEEDVYHRSARYGDPQVYNAIELSGTGETATTTQTGPADIEKGDLFFCELAPGEDPTQSVCMQDKETWIAEISTDINKELKRLMQPDKEADPVFAYAPIGHVNYWREPDGVAAGLDGWGELHYNYVVFSKDSDLTEGGSAKGAFSLVLDADQSSTRMFVQGQFEIDKIKKDKWTTQDLQQDKLIEAGVELCSAASEEDAAPSGN